MPDSDPIASASYALYLIGTAILNAKTMWSLLQSVLAAEEKFGKACNFVFAGKCQGYMDDLETASRLHGSEILPWLTVPALLSTPTRVQASFSRVSCSRLCAWRSRFGAFTSRPSRGCSHSAARVSVGRSTVPRTKRKTRSRKRFRTVAGGERDERRRETGRAA